MKCAWRSRWMIWVESSGGLEAEPGADVFLDARIEMRVGADGAGEFADGDLFARFDQPLFGAAEFVVHERELEAVGDRLGVDAVRAAHHGREFVFFGADSDGDAEFPQVFQQQIGAGDTLQGQGGVEQVGGGEAAMDEPAGSADVGGDFLQEGDDVVVGALLVFAHFFDVVGGLGADDLGVLGGNVADGGHAFASEDFDFEPVGELGFFAPKRGHLGPGIAGDHEAKSLERGAEM